MLAEKAVVVVSLNASLQRALQWVLLVTVPRTVLDDAANLEMGPGNDAGASTDCVRQPGPKEVSTDCVRQARSKAGLRPGFAQPVGKVVSWNASLQRTACYAARQQARKVVHLE